MNEQRRPDDDIWAGTYGDLWNDDLADGSTEARGDDSRMPWTLVVWQVIWGVLVLAGWLFGAMWAYGLAGGEIIGDGGPNAVLFVPMLIIVTLLAGAVVGEPTIRFRRRQGRR